MRRMVVACASLALLLALLPSPALAAEPGSITGFKFWDDNRDGIWDQDDGDGTVESALNGWSIELYLDDGNDTFGVEDVLIQTVVSSHTGTDGEFVFTELAPGTYFLKEQLMTGYVQTTPVLEGDGVIKVEIESGDQVGPEYNDVPGLQTGDIVFGNDPDDEPSPSPSASGGTGGETEQPTDPPTASTPGQPGSSESLGPVLLLLAVLLAAMAVLRPAHGRRGGR